MHAKFQASRFNNTKKLGNSTIAAHSCELPLACEFMHYLDIIVKTAWMYSLVLLGNTCLQFSL